MGDGSHRVTPAKRAVMGVGVYLWRPHGLEDMARVLRRGGAD